MKRALGFAYGVACYLVFLAVFAYLVGFVDGAVVFRSIDEGSPGSTMTAAAVNLGLLALFAVQHSGMARQGFKERWKEIVPAHLERSTYVLAASLVLALVMWRWRPMPETVWSVEEPTVAAALRGTAWLGWAVVLVATFLIDHFRLFGLKQVWAHLTDREDEPPEFQTPGLYRYVRHPLYVGFLLAFWSTPDMSVGRLLFAAVLTGWILLAIRMEERDLIRFHGDDYREYRRSVPMLVPLSTGSRGGLTGGGPTAEGRRVAG